VNSLSVLVAPVSHFLDEVELVMVARGLSRSRYSPSFLPKKDDVKMFTHRDGQWCWRDDLRWTEQGFECEATSDSRKPWEKTLGGGQNVGGWLKE